MKDETYVMAISVADARFHDLAISRRRDGRHVRLSNGRRGKAVGRYASVKMGATLPWESRLELGGLYRSEVDTAVLNYAVQPETLSWTFQGKRRRYTPDRLDRMADGTSRIIEIKDTFNPNDDLEYSEKLEQAAQIYRMMGYSFHLHDRSQISAEPDFSAVEEIQAYRRAVVTVEDACHIREALCRETLSLRDASTAIARSQPRSVLFAMMVRRIVSIDLTGGLHDGAEVSLVPADL